MRKVRTFIVRHGEKSWIDDGQGNQIPCFVKAHHCDDLPSFYHCVTHLICLQSPFEVEFIFQDELEVPTRQEVLDV